MAVKRIMLVVALLSKASSLEMDHLGTIIVPGDNSSQIDVIYCTGFMSDQTVRIYGQNGESVYEYSYQYNNTIERYNSQPNSYGQREDNSVLILKSDALIMVSSLPNNTSVYCECNDRNLTTSRMDAISLSKKSDGEMTVEAFQLTKQPAVERIIVIASNSTSAMVCNYLSQNFTSDPPVLSIGNDTLVKAFSIDNGYQKLLTVFNNTEAFNVTCWNDINKVEIQIPAQAYPTSSEWPTTGAANTPEGSSHPVPTGNITATDSTATDNKAIPIYGVILIALLIIIVAAAIIGIGIGLLMKYSSYCKKT